MIFSETYFSENALLPGLVKGQLNDNTGSSYRDHFRELNAEAQHYETETPHAYLISKFKNLRLETYSHNFTLNYPLKKNTVSPINQTCNYVLHNYNYYYDYFT